MYKAFSNVFQTRPILSLAFVSAAITCPVVLPGGEPAANAEATFEQYCFACHGEATATAGIDLKKLTAEESVSESFRQWEKVAVVLEQGNMPPKGMPQPTAAKRRQAADWIVGALDEYAAKHAGDPGPVTVRRLTSGEYAYTVRDLTGLDLNMERDFAGDAVGGEGFTNFGDVQFMADANIESYLEAAKKIADHAVIGSGPLDFFGDPGMSGFELSAIHRIHDIYRKHGFRAVAAEGGRAFGLARYGNAFYAAWRYRHRKILGEPNVSLEELGARHGLSPRFTRHIWSVVQQDAPTFPLSAVVSRWQALPTPVGPGDVDSAAVRKQCGEIQAFVIGWPRELFAAGALAAGGAGDERALVITDASLAASKSGKVNYLQRLPEGGEARAHFNIASMDSDSAETSFVIWRNPTVQVRGEDRKTPEHQPLRSFLDEATVAKLGFGKHPGGDEIGPNDFVMASDTTFVLDVPLPASARGLNIKADVEIDSGTGGSAVLRCTVSEAEGFSQGTPAWVLLADTESDGYRRWKRNVLEYAANLPQTSHGEPTPSDRDPIPAPLDNTYNQPERDRFHYRVKYFRDDAFLVDKMLDDATSVKLDQAWADAMASFEFHDAFLDLLENKFDLGIDGQGIADLDDKEIVALPAEPRPYVKALRDEYNNVVAVQMAAHPRHIEDSIAFASEAWRRPLSEKEKDDLRRFYSTMREDGGLDHRKAIRALLTRVLVAPAFLYRLEQPSAPSGVTQLSDWELANRMSYFLWSSKPDSELRRAAEAGELSDPKQVERQVRRMLADPKARRLATEFFGQWLGFYRFDQYRGVDAERFPEFTDKVKAAMHDESVSFFEYIIREERPVREMVSADYTFLNKVLAEHYGVAADVALTDKIERVAGADVPERGGLLRLGAVLTATSAPLRTSPVKRGDWVLRRVLGTPTPPPPPDTGSIPADDKLFGEQTVRQRLEAHRTSPSCMSCHTRIDPLGFPLEHYDAVGRWRSEYSNGKPIDATTTLGEMHNEGVDDLVEHLRAEEKQVLRNFSGKLLGYALGRTILLSDQPLVDQLIEAGGGASFADLAVEIVSSRQFRYQRGREDMAPAAVQSGE